MNKIIINRGSFKLDEVVFEQGTTTIGRANTNTIVLDDSAVSSHHAKIVTLFNTSYIEDLDSTNGTLVNGKPAQKRTLHSGDVVSLGNHQLLFQSDDAHNREADETSDTVLLKGNEIKQKLTEFLQAQVEIQQNHSTIASETHNREIPKPISTNGKGSNIPQQGTTPQNPGFGRPGSTDDGNKPSLDKNKNRAWLEPKNQPLGGVNSSTARSPSTGSVHSAANTTKGNASQAADALASATANSSLHNDRQPAAQVITNTATAIRSDRKADIPAFNTASTLDPALQDDVIDSDSTPKSPVDIAAAARSALQNRRSSDAEYPHNYFTPQRTPATKKAPRSSAIASDLAAKGGAIAINNRRPGNKILRMLWLIIVAVLVAEVVYIGYRSLG
jgi:pSer/pThr/pTyr-binding forkhead associated (FHA) protein